MNEQDIRLLKLNDLVEAASLVAEHASAEKIHMRRLIAAMREYNQSASNVSMQSIPAFIRQEGERYFGPTREAINRIAQLVEREYY